MKRTINQDTENKSFTFYKKCKWNKKWRSVHKPSILALLIKTTDNEHARRKVLFWIMGKSVYRWINHKCYNERRGWYIHSVSQWRAAIRGNTNMPTLFQLQSWRWIHNSCRTYHQVQSWQQHSQVVFLTDALSVLQALINDSLPQLEQALYTITTFRTVLQLIPSHSGVHGNE